MSPSIFLLTSKVGRWRERGRRPNSWKRARLCSRSFGLKLILKKGADVLLLEGLSSIRENRRVSLALRIEDDLAWRRVCAPHRGDLRPKSDGTYVIEFRTAVGEAQLNRDFHLLPLSRCAGTLSLDPSSRPRASTISSGVPVIVRFRILRPRNCFGTMTRRFHAF